MLTGENPILAIIPTNGGKSLLFFLLISLEAALYIIIIIVLILALYADFIRRYIIFNIICCA